MVKQETKRDKGVGVIKSIKDHPDYLRSPEVACRPDPRNEAFSVMSEHVLRTKSLEDQYKGVARLPLHQDVPAPIRVQFEVTKNLYLYSWFVYRFYPVAHHHAYTVLELALRERFAEEHAIAEKARLEKKGKKLRKDYKPTLWPLLKFAIDNQYLKNENFEVWRHQTLVNAKMRTMYELISEMSRLGLEEMPYDETKVEIKEVDRGEDYVGKLLKVMPKIRNHYAHGHTSLHNQVLGTIVVVSEVINQIFPCALQRS